VGYGGRNGGKQFYKEVLLSLSGNLRKGLMGHLGDGSS